jgi:putative heme-binding domain-containing protein
VAPSDSKYAVSKIDLATVDGSIQALLNPNSSWRFLGWKSLEQMGEKAEDALKKIWDSDNSRQRAQAFWLLIRLNGKSDAYLAQALNDKDPNIRIAGIRGARLLKKDVASLAARLVEDSSPQVRREVALAIRGNSSPAAAELWTRLAGQYDGKDRWYLEALGISAEGNSDLYFDTWKKKVGDQWNSPSNADIVWRSRSKSAMPLLATLINSSDEKSMLRYYRAFDFHSDPSKQTVLASLIEKNKSAKVLFALKHMDPSKLKMTPSVKAALNSALDEQKGKLEFVELVTSFKLEDRAKELLQLALQFPDSTTGKESARTLLRWDKVEMFRAPLNSPKKEEALAMIKVLSAHMNNHRAISIMESVVLDTTKDLEIRRVAVKAFGGPWESEDRLLALAKDKKIPEDLHTAAAGVFQTAWRALLRDEAAAYLKLPGSKEGASLPAISVLVDKKGDHVKGKEVFTSLCSSCHQVKNEGVNFGPDLSEIGSKLSKEALYTSILYPDQGISFGFEGFRIALNDGSTAFGRIVSETPEKIDIQYMSNQQTIDKSKVTSRIKLETSLMPSNLQSSMSEQGLVDLVEYLGSLKKSDERISKK